MHSNFLYAEQQNNINQTLFMRSNSLLDLLDKGRNEEEDSFADELCDLEGDFDSPRFTDLVPNERFTFKRMVTNYVENACRRIQVRIGRRRFQ